MIPRYVLVLPGRCSRWFASVTKSKLLSNKSAISSRVPVTKPVSHGNESPPGVSNRKKFRETKVDTDLVKTIAALGLGTRTRRGRQPHAQGQVKGPKRHALPVRKVHKWNTTIRETSEKVDRLFTAKCKLLSCARSEEEFPKIGPPYVPEIAFAGRSNAGKSTLLRALSIRGVNVRVSEKPGTTNTLDWFELKARGGHETATVRLVDLPGYGFAFARAEVQRQWHGLTEKFLRTRQRVLKRVMLLVDARYGFKQLDNEFMALLTECRLKFQVVLTKCDLVSVDDLARKATLMQDQVQGYLPYACLPIMMVSGRNKIGVEAIQKAIASVIQLSPADVLKEGQSLGNVTPLKEPDKIPAISNNKLRARMLSPWGAPKPLLATAFKDRDLYQPEHAW